MRIKVGRYLSPDTQNPLRASSSTHLSSLLSYSKMGCRDKRLPGSSKACEQAINKRRIYLMLRIRYPGCPLTSTCMLQHICTQSYTHESIQCLKEQTEALPFAPLPDCYYVAVSIPAYLCLLVMELETLFSLVSVHRCQCLQDIIKFPFPHSR